MKARILAFLLGACWMLQPAAATLPDLGDVATSELSPQAERRLGESIMRELRQKEPAYLDDPEAEEYLNRLGRKLVSASSMPDGSFEFFLVRDPTLNAFALPGGFIGVHSGLILAAQSESELASVLGHEIAHVSQRHIAQMVGRQSQAGMLMLASLLVAVLAARSSSDLAEAAVAAGQAGAIQSQLGYSRDFEREADRLGLQTLETAGFDVRGMPSFFERLQKAGRLYENNAPAYLRTHPLTMERIADMGNRVEGMRYRQITDSTEFLLIQARLAVQQASVAEAIAIFEARLAVAGNEQADRYGLASAYLRAGRLDDARKQLAAMSEAERKHPLVMALDAELLTARKDHNGAVARLQAARQANPDLHSVRYRLIEAQLLANQPRAARDAAKEGLSLGETDTRMWTLLARSEAALGRRTAQHRAQAEAYALTGALPAAIQQLEQARDAKDGDFYELSAVDARLRELKTRQRELLKERGELPRDER